MSTKTKPTQTIIALSGGVGGAKLANGLASILPPEELLIVANTGDDFDHLNLRVCPDLDSVMYALAGMNDTERGWGIRDESWQFMAALTALKGETWFNLGDKDLATHIQRSQYLAQGMSLSEATAKLCQALDISASLIPMTNDSIQTIVQTDQGELAFQEYFVARQCEPKVKDFYFKGIEQAKPEPRLLEAVNNSHGAIIICPSNPFVSIDPILQLNGVKAAIQQSALPCVAVSPIIAGQAVKGPAAKMLLELGKEVTALAVAEHYQGLISHFVLDERDAALAPAIEQLGMKLIVCDTLMTNTDKQTALAATILNEI